MAATQQEVRPEQDQQDNEEMKKLRLFEDAA